MSDSLATSDSFQFFNTFYDLLYLEKDYAKEAEYVSGIIKSFNPDANELLELGSGTGNYSKPLSEAGYKITGVEINEPMVAIAASKAIPHFVPVVGDITTFSLHKKFDAAISLFHVISYLPDNEKLMACLQQVHQHLKKDGLFIFDVWYTPAVYTQQPQNKIRRIANTQFDLTRVAEPLINYEKNVVDVNYQLIVKNKKTAQNDIFYETHTMRHFSTPEIKLMAKLSGFHFVRAEEFLTAKQPCADTWGVCYILQKND